MAHTHSLKSVRIRSYSGPHSVQTRENTDQTNSEYGHFLHSDSLHTWYYFTVFFYKFMFDLYLLHMFWMINNWEEQVILNAKNEIFVRFLQRLFIILVKNYFALDIMQVK